MSRADTVECILWEAKKHSKAAVICIRKSLSWGSLLTHPHLICDSRTVIITGRASALSVSPLTHYGLGSPPFALPRDASAGLSEGSYGGGPILSIVLCAAVRYDFKPAVPNIKSICVCVWSGILLRFVRKRRRTVHWYCGRLLFVYTKTARLSADTVHILSEPWSKYLGTINFINNMYIFKKKKRGLPPPFNSIVSSA